MERTLFSYSLLGKEEFLWILFLEKYLGMTNRLQGFEYQWTLRDESNRRMENSRFLWEHSKPLEQVTGDLDFTGMAYGSRDFRGEQMDLTAFFLWVWRRRAK